MNKTGTMSGVSTLAGYADTKSHGRVRFVISMKGKGGATRFQVLNAIELGFSGGGVGPHSPRTYKSSVCPAWVRSGHRKALGSMSA
jgi:hypothetical protein